MFVEFRLLTPVQSVRILYIPRLAGWLAALTHGHDGLSPEPHTRLRSHMLKADYFHFTCASFLTVSLLARTFVWMRRCEYKYHSQLQILQLLTIVM